jgi:RNA polymerase sigma-70 factor (ECF subfamily)
MRRREVRTNMDFVKNITVTEAQELGRALDASAETFQMDEQSFRTFYDRTARLLWAYLYRISGNNASLADDLVQESYYRFLRIKLPAMDQEYMKNYLFRIGTNLLRDHWRRAKLEPLPLLSSTVSESTVAADAPAHSASPERFHAKSDVSRVLAEMKPRERELLWLAYVEGSSHREIAGIVGMKEQSIRTMLFRARQKLAGLLKRRGLAVGSAGE